MTVHGIDDDAARLDAASFLERLMEHRSEERAGKRDPLKSSADDVVIGVRMKVVFDLAKEFIDMPLDQVEILLESPIHEARVGAVSIMDKQARRKRTPESRRKELFELYLRRHDRIDYWDLVDRAAPWVVGGYLSDKPRDVLYELARSKNTWERRTAIVSTYYFIREGETDDTFAIAEILVDDDHDLIQKAVADGFARPARETAPPCSPFSTTTRRRCRGPRCVTRSSISSRSRGRGTWR